MTRQIELKTTTRRDLMMLTGAAVAAGGAAQVLGTDAFAQTTAGKIKAIGFDAYTIFNPLSVDAVIDETFPGKGTQLASAWRGRIFEYCWLRTLNRTYVDFWQVLDDALVLAFKAAKIEHILSTDRVKAYKPDPRAYQMAEVVFNLPRESIVFAAFGGWDAAGAKSFGLNTFWVNQVNAPLEELGVKPDAIGRTLLDDALGFGKIRHCIARSVRRGEAMSAKVFGLS